MQKGRCSSKAVFIFMLLAAAGCNGGGGGSGSSGGGDPTDDGTSTADGGGQDGASVDVTWIHPRPAGGDYRDITQGGGQYVVIGDEGRYLVSPDGDTWSAGALPEADDLAAVAFLDSRFVAVGSSDTSGKVVYTSSDGADWTRYESHNTGLTPDPAAVVRPGSEYLIAGREGVSVSTDLTATDSWTLERSSTQSLNDIACNATGDACVAVGAFDLANNHHTILHRDGQGNWSDVGIAVADEYWAGDLRSVAWTGSGWVAVGESSNIVASSDGTTWVERENYDSLWNGSVEDVTFTDVARTDGGLLAVGYYDDGNDKRAVALTGATDGTGWSVAADEGSWGQLQAVLRDDAGSLQAVGTPGDIHASADNGSTWTDATTLLTPNYLVSLARNDSGLLLAGGKTDILQRDDAGQLQRFTSTGMWQPELVWDGQQFIAFYSTKAAVSTDDGASWTESDISPCSFSGDQEALRADGELVVSGTSGVCKGSPGSGWSVHDTGYGSTGSDYLNGIAHDGTTYVVVGNSGHVATSPDGAAWTVQSAPTSSTLYDVAWTGSEFVAVGASGLVMTSPAGSSWTEVTGLPDRTFTGVVADADGGTLLMASGAVCHSAETALSDCELVELRADGSLYDALWADDSFLVSGDDGLLVRVTP